MLLISHVARSPKEASTLPSPIPALSKGSHVQAIHPSIEVMAPLPGNEADHLREKARRDLLNLLESVSLWTSMFPDVY